MFDRTELGNFYHNEGYRNQEKVFKMFVFSNLFGKYEIVENNICFENRFWFYLSALDERFIEEIYNFLSLNHFLIIHHQKVEISEVNILNGPGIKQEDTIWLHTLSPVTVYSTSQNKTTYYAPGDPLFEKYIIQNIQNKSIAYHYPLDSMIFKIIQFQNVKERMVKFKDSHYLSYLFDMQVQISRDVFILLYNAGLSSKNSCGFGMVDIKREKNNLFVSER